MTGPTSAVAELHRLALDTYREEYRDLSETWKNLDTKAQGMGAIAGIFLAAVFAWAREMPVSFAISLRLLVVTSIALLVVSIIAAVLGLHVRQVASPPLGQETAEMVRDILGKQRPEEAPERLIALCNDQITAWSDTNRDMAEHSQRKAARIAIGQAALLLAAVLVAALSILAILRPAG